MRFEGASSAPRLVQKIAFFGPWSCWCFGLFGSEADETLSSCNPRTYTCVYMRFEGASSAPLLVQKSRPSGLDPADVSVFSDRRRTFGPLWARIEVVLGCFASIADELHFVPYRQRFGLFCACGFVAELHFLCVSRLGCGTAFCPTATFSCL